MKKVYLFNPENDLALVKDSRHFTPPAVAMLLRRAGEALPLWYGDPGDSFISTGINASWLDGIRNSFGIDIDVFDYQPSDKVPTPWGWSRSAYNTFIDYGFEASALPTFQELDKIRTLSHRRTSIRLHSLLPGQYLTEAPVELAAFDQIEQYVASHGQAVLKLPYSSSGRGVIVVDSETLQRRITEVKGMLRNQESVLAEPFVDKSSDFAFLYEMQNGKALYKGLSLFSTERLGTYSGNIILPQREIEEELIKLSSAESFCAVRESVTEALTQIIGDTYSGAVGVDMMTVKGSERLALCELNLRMTMGHLCLSVQNHHLVQEARGTFKIAETPEPDCYELSGKRMVSGTLNLNPPSSRIHFLIKLQ